MAELIEVSKLKLHPRNNEFFDDIINDNWMEFLESVKNNGVIEAITITDDYTVVSGHQRIRACKELGIRDIPYTIKEYVDTESMTIEDAILLDLIDANLKQRSGGNPNPVKFAKCIKELERIYDIRSGSAGKVKTVLEGNNFTPKTQDDLASKLNRDKRQLNNYKKLLDTIPEIQEAVETGKLSATTAYKIWAKLPEDEQTAFFNEFGEDKVCSMSGNETQKEVDKLKSQNEHLKNEIEILRNKEPMTVEVVPRDYEQIKQDNNKLSDEVADLRDELHELELLEEIPQHLSLFSFSRQIDDTKAYLYHFEQHFKSQTLLSQEQIKKYFDYIDSIKHDIENLYLLVSSTLRPDVLSQPSHLKIEIPQDKLKANGSEQLDGKAVLQEMKAKKAMVQEDKLQKQGSESTLSLKDKIEKLDSNTKKECVS